MNYDFLCNNLWSPFLSALCVPFHDSFYFFVQEIWRHLWCWSFYKLFEGWCAHCSRYSWLVHRKGWTFYQYKVSCFSFSYPLHYKLNTGSILMFVILPFFHLNISTTVVSEGIATPQSHEPEKKALLLLLCWSHELMNLKGNLTGLLKAQYLGSN